MVRRSTAESLTNPVLPRAARAANALGRYAVVRGLVGGLSTRLRLHRLAGTLPAHPMPNPLIIVGLPRSGTTLLRRLIAQDPDRRSAPFWEVNFPLPAGDRPPGAGSDPRIRAGAAALRAMCWTAPGRTGGC
jgi:hypothetical protein